MENIKEVTQEMPNSRIAAFSRSRKKKQTMTRHSDTNTKLIFKEKMRRRTALEHKNIMAFFIAAKN